jgi:hypothetical protein
MSALMGLQWSSMINKIAMKPFRFYITVGSSLASTHRCFLAIHKTSIVDADQDRTLIQWVRSRREKITHKNRKKLIKNLIFLSVGCSLLRTEGFSCSLDPDSMNPNPTRQKNLGHPFRVPIKIFHEWFHIFCRTQAHEFLFKFEMHV